MVENSVIRTGGSRVLAATAALSLVLAGTSPLSAQEATATLAAETAGDDVSLLLGDLTAAWGAGAIAPVTSLQAYVVWFDAGQGSDQIFAVNPAVGLRARSATGFLQGTVGYSFQTADAADPGVPFFGGGGDGITTTLHAEHWGTGRLGLQGIGTYNWGAQYLWSRARGTVALGSGPEGVHAGAEAGWQGYTGDGGYEAVQVGPVLRLVTPRMAGAVGAGWKGVRGAGGEDTWYARFELTLPVFSR